MARKLILLLFITYTCYGQFHRLNDRTEGFRLLYGGDSYAPLPQVTLTGTPPTPYASGYFRFNGIGGKQLLRGRSMKWAQFKMGACDTAYIEVWFRNVGARKLLMGAAQANWMIGTGAHDGTNCAIFSNHNGAWVNLFALPLADSSLKKMRLVWHRSDSLLLCYVNDTLKSTNTFKFGNAYSNQPFAVGHGNVVQATEGAGTVPTSADYFNGEVFRVTLRNFYNGTDSGAVYNFNNGYELVQDSATATNGTGDNSADGLSGFHLHNGFRLGYDTCNASYRTTGDYTSQVTTVGNPLQNWVTNYWSGGQLWNVENINDTAIAIAGIFNRFNVTLSNDASGDTALGTGFYSLNSNQWYRTGLGSFSGVGNNYTEKVIFYSGGLVYSGPFTSMAGVSNTQHIAKWTNGVWSSIGNINGNIRALFVHGGNLYAGGVFTTAGGTTVRNVAMYNGSAWSSLDMVKVGCNNEIEDFATYQGSLYMNGRFDSSGNLKTNHITRWDGTNFYTVGSGLTGGPESGVGYALEVYNDELYSIGSHTIPAPLCAWNGTSWRAVITSWSGFFPRSLAMCVHKGLLYVGGSFYTVDGKIVNKLFVTNGRDVQPVNYGTDLEIWNMASLGDYLYVAGWFYQMDGQYTPSNFCKIYIP